MRVLKLVVTVIAVIALVAVAAVGSVYFWNKDMDRASQTQLDEFYSPPTPLIGSPGDVIRTERAEAFDVPGSRAFRMLYVTESVTGGTRASSGMYWIPDKPAKGARKVIAWAHPTVGLGTDCVPSRVPGNRSFKATVGWLEQMAGLGWVVTATDYAGLGTPPPYTYLVGRQEASDVVNSVRAVRNVPAAEAGTKWGVFGHSQGGHSALWTGTLAKDIAPELDLVGVAAAAPASLLPVIIDQQWDKIVAWVIGPEAMLSWPVVFPELQPSEIVNPAAANATESEALDCLLKSALGGALRQELMGQRYFSVNPLTIPSWAARFDTESAKPLPASMPLFVGQGTADKVVMADTNALLQQQWCEAGSDLTMEWLGGVNHQNAAKASGPAVVDWFIDVFDGNTPKRNCQKPPPVKPYELQSAESG
ncbi:MAG: lipase family protein [Candidatus Nanopelagicales bacterium]|nr:lipase family protein [Candidatus Nanopelagicales bacterium]MDZ4250661.1 lipase family protein [Candidatus Nanopelagicales bacterium]MDZ7578203.1 lipase family protein [Candidatus Nanopelagicales bacterium]